MMFKLVLIIADKKHHVYRDTKSGAYEGANKLLERHEYPAASAELFQRTGPRSWTRIDRQEVSDCGMLRH